MKKYLLSLVAFAGLFACGSAHAEAIGGKPYHQVIYLRAAADSPTPSASYAGRDYGQAKPLSDGNLLAIPKNVVITNVYVLVDGAVAGLTAFNIGDTDSASGYIASSSPATELASTGMKYWDLPYKGVYLKNDNIVTNHEFAKYYSASGKYLTLDVTGTAAVGSKMRVIVDGYAVGASGL